MTNLNTAHLFVRGINNQMDWLQMVIAGLSGSSLITAFLIIRRVSRLELQVELMWASFERNVPGMRRLN